MAPSRPCSRAVATVRASDAEGSRFAGARCALTSTDKSNSALQAHLHFYQLLDIVTLAYGQRSLEALIHPVLAHLELSQPPSEALGLEIDRTGEEWRVLQGGQITRVMPGSAEPTAYGAGDPQLGGASLP